MTTENNEGLAITEGDGQLIHHANGDVTIVPDDVSDEDAAALAQLDGADIAQAVEAKATEAAAQAAAQARAEATQEVIDHPEDVRRDIGAAELGGRTDPTGVASDLANADRKPGPQADPLATAAREAQADPTPDPATDKADATTEGHTPGPKFTG